MNQVTLKLKLTQVQAPHKNNGVVVSTSHCRLELAGLAPNENDSFLNMLPPQLIPRCFHTGGNSARDLILVITLSEVLHSYQEEFRECVEVLKELNYVQVDAKFVQDKHENYQMWTFRKDRKRRRDMSDEDENECPMKK